MKHYWQSFISTFIHKGKVYWPLVALYLTINTIVLLNTVFHNPFVGYDIDGHVDYVATLAQGHLPEKNTNHEFFSPPLTYAIPALLKAAGLELRDAVRAELFVNFFASLGITYLVLRLIKQFAIENTEIQILALLILGMIPAYYKTLSFLRGEPLVAFFTLWAVHLSLKIFITKDFRPINVIFLGTSLGMSILSRQWAFFIFPALILFVGAVMLRNKEIRIAAFKTLAYSIMIAFILGAWFYIGLFIKYGTVTAFNHGPSEVNSLSPTFFTTISNKNLFNDPVRPSMPDQFWPIMHSEIWGDYWGYFSVFAYRPQTGSFITGREFESISPNANPQNMITNRFTFNQYLGRVNFVSLFPSFLFIVGLIYGLIQIIRVLFGRTDVNGITEGFLAMIILFTLTGYTWWMVQYPAPDKGDTTKASYILNVFPLLALLIASFFQRIFSQRKWILWVLIFSLALIMLYDSRAMVTHVIYFPW